MASWWNNAEPKHEGTDELDVDQPKHEGADELDVVLAGRSCTVVSFIMDMLL